MKTYAETQQELVHKDENSDKAFVTFKGENQDDEFSDIVDAIIEIPKENKKTYVMLKGYDTQPATIADVAKLSYIKKHNNRKGHKNDEYLIFCEREGNQRTADIARNYGINYISRDVDLNTEFKRYFDDR